MSTVMTPVHRLLLYLLALLLVWGMLDRMGARTSRRATAEGNTLAPPATPAGDGQPKVTEAASAEMEKGEKPANSAPAGMPKAPHLTLWDLYKKGGVLMYPITFLSFIVVCFGIERFLGLRRGVVIPRRLVRRLRNMAAEVDGLNPQSAHAVCEEYSGAAANVAKAMLAKAGRPDIEVEQAVTAANEREASRLYLNVRWLNMAMSTAPMLGLLGTVQGMIIVFMGVSNLPVGANKAAYMAEGIYLKLICTFAGLIVAIPAAVLSYLFEARIQWLLGDVEDLVLKLLPRMKHFESQRRRRGGATGPSETE